MKYLIVSIILFGTVNAWAHKPVKVQTQEQAVQRYTDQAVTFKTVAIPENAKFVKELKHGQAASIHMVTFTVKADWGPIMGLVALREGKVLGLEILLFTEHEGKGVTREVFLNQFKGLSHTNLETKTIKPLPKEPKTSRALLEAVKYSLKAGHKGYIGE
jgi:hypothetical protein